MSRKLKQWMIGILAVFTMLVWIPAGSLLQAYAATARIAFSDPNVTVGQEFSVNVKITSQDGNLGASDIMLSYDPSSIEFVSGNNASGGAGSIRLIGTMDSGNTTQFSHTLKFKALQAGNSAISVGSYEIYDVDTQAVTVSKVGSSAVSVNAPATYSSEARLSSLKVSPGQLSPAFSSDVTSYTVNVGGDVNKLAVSAGAKDGKAKVLVSGDSGLKTGANTVVCKVTAEDGKTTKSYTITVNKAEAVNESAETEPTAEETSGTVLGEQTVEIEGAAYTIAASFDASLLPEGYTQSSASYQGSDVMCGTGNGMTLLYLQGADGTGSFFIYTPETEEFSPYVTIDVAAKSILVLPIDESVSLPDGFAATTIQLNGNHKVQGWVWQSDETHQYCVVYGMNEDGEKNLYRYDIEERTFQRYFSDPALQSKYDDAKVAELIDQYNSLCEDYNFRFIIIVVLLVVCLILFFLVINLLLHRKDSSVEEKKTVKKPEVNRQKAQTVQRQTAPADRTGAKERRAAYERAVAAERKASMEQTAVSRQSEKEERRSEAAQRRASERAEALDRRMSGGYQTSEERRMPERAVRERTVADKNHDPGMEELIRRRERERAERARLERERAERERQEKERQANKNLDDDDFEFIDL